MDIEPTEATCMCIFAYSSKNHNHNRGYHLMRVALLVETIRYASVSVEYTYICLVGGISNLCMSCPLPVVLSVLLYSMALIMFSLICCCLIVAGRNVVGMMLEVVALIFFFF